MKISTKKGDGGYTSTPGGERIPKHHLITEAVGAIDEANSLLGLARASAEDKKIQRIILHVQKDLFVIGAQLSFADGKGRKQKKQISDLSVRWLERLVNELEEVLSLPPGFVAFGGEISASQMDVARTGVRKAERIAVRMQSEGLLENPDLLKYLNRLSDLIFLLAAYEENSGRERKKISLSSLSVQLSDSVFRKWFIVGGFVVISLVMVLSLLLIFHRPSTDTMSEMMNMHMQEGMHKK